MRERPILFSGPMVRAILDGRKTQTRRIIKPQPPEGIDDLHGGKLSQRAPYRLEHPETGQILGNGFEDEDGRFYKCPYGFVGDVLWVRECFGTDPYASQKGHTELHYRADWKGDSDYPMKWKPSIHMPKVACRLRLRITDIRVERLQDITEADAGAEGCDVNIPDGYPCAVACFHDLWQSINGPDSWHHNPWVWVVNFHRLEKHDADA